MKLVPNLCAECRQPVGYVTKEALQIPTICIACAGDDETMKDWGHSLEGGQAKHVCVMRRLYGRLQEMLR